MCAHPHPGPSPHPVAFEGAVGLWKALLLKFCSLLGTNRKELPPTVTGACFSAGFSRCL